MENEGLGMAPEPEGAMTQGEAANQEAIQRAEVDIMISTARRYPRNERECVNAALSLATADQDMASGCFYKLPRGGKVIEGPSVRLAEIMVYAWGHTRSGARIIGQSQKDITLQSSFIDLQRNNGVIQEVRRRIQYADGTPYNDDMIQVTTMAGAAIAWRNGVFRIIPRGYVNRIMKEAQRVAVGDARTLEERRAKCVAAFQKYGIFEPVLCAHMGIAKPEEIDLDGLDYLIGIFNSIRDGEMDVNELSQFDRWGTEIESEKKPSNLRQAAEKMRGQKTEQSGQKPADEENENAGDAAAAPEPEANAGEPAADEGESEAAESSEDEEAPWPEGAEQTGEAEAPEAETPHTAAQAAETKAPGQGGGQKRRGGTRRKSGGQRDQKQQQPRPEPESEAPNQDDLI